MCDQKIYFSGYHLQLSQIRHLFIYQLSPLHQENLDLYAAATLASRTMLRN